MNRQTALILMAAASIALAASAASADPIFVPVDQPTGLKGEQFRIESRTTKRAYTIHVRLPADYAKEPARRYPIVYLTDGDGLFPVLGGSHILLNLDEKLPEAIIVGIAYGSFDPAINRRDVDYSAPAPGIPPGKAGAPAFHLFLKSELMPLVERRYRADPGRRILFGQSLGGAFVLYSAFAEPDLFWGRIASNPVIERFRPMFYDKAARANRRDLGLFVASGSRDTPPLRAGALAWFDEWAGRADKPWALKTMTIEGGTHAASSVEVYRAALLWLFGRETAR